MKLNQILIGTFVLFLIIVILELAYLFSPNIQTKLSPTPIPSIKPTSTQNAEQNLLDRKRKQQTEGLLKNVYYVEEYEGKILSIEQKDGIKQYGSQTYKYKVKLIIKNDITQQSFFWNDLDLQSTQVFQLVNNQKKQISLSKLKPGDRISIKTTMDFLKDTTQNMVNNVITKI